MTVPRPVPWALRNLLVGRTLNGEMGALPEPYRRLAFHLNGLPPDGRQVAMDGFLCGLTADTSAALIRAMAEADPDAPPPDEGPPRRTAHLGDLGQANENGRFLWPKWIVRSHFTLLTSEPKVGKTRVGLEISKRLYYAMDWPDGQPATLPAGTKTLWVPGDRQQDEMRDLARAYGLPDDAVLLNAAPEDPYGGISLDDMDNVNALRERVIAERPGIVFIDTVWRSTRRRLFREDEVNQLMDPLLSIAQDCDVAIVGMMHASKDGETLGRRLEGLARAVIKLTKPDPEGAPDRRKLWVDRANFLEPPPLGATVHDTGCNFDFNPPAEAPQGRPNFGRPAGQRDKAIAFLIERLSEGDAKQCVLINEWEAKGESKGTLFNAMRTMQDDGRLVIDTTAKPKICHLVKKDADGSGSDF